MDNELINYMSNYCDVNNETEEFNFSLNNYVNNISINCYYDNVYNNKLISTTSNE